MMPDSHWPAMVMIVAVLAFVALAVTWRGPGQPAVDLRYFHLRPGLPDGFLNLADASMQVKGIAANRHASPQEVRHLMEKFTEGHDQEPLGRGRTNVRDLNRALDERWPIK